MILLKKDAVFNWGPKADMAFSHLKSAFVSSPVLAHFNPKKPCFLEPDASKTALGIVMSQPDANGELHPVAFYSWSLTPLEHNYHVHDTELLATIKGLEHWCHYFTYSNVLVMILTDHKNLKYFTEKHQLSEQQIHYAEQLSKFVFKVICHAGVLNGAADALSQVIPPKEGDSVLHEPLLPPMETMALQAATIDTRELSRLTARIQLA